MCEMTNKIMTRHRLEIYSEYEFRTMTVCVHFVSGE